MLSNLRNLLHEALREAQTKGTATVRAEKNNLGGATCFIVHKSGAVTVHCEDVRGVSLGLDVRHFTRLLENQYGWERCDTPR